MTIDYLTIFNSKPILDRIYLASTLGRLRYGVKKNLRYIEPHWEDISEWLLADALDNGWEKNGPLPISDTAFISRFESFLKENKAEMEPFKINEEDLQHVDVISGEEENTIDWLLKSQ